jgi:hypothetical protein
MRSKQKGKVIHVNGMVLSVRNATTYKEAAQYLATKRTWVLRRTDRYVPMHHAIQSLRPYLGQEASLRALQADQREVKLTLTGVEGFKLSADLIGSGYTLREGC